MRWRLMSGVLGGGGSEGSFLMGEMGSCMYRGGEVDGGGFGEEIRWIRPARRR